ncbi:MULTISPECIES: pyridoxal phosphate-dependent aminotransferase [Clostridium]|uniref:Aminotransferase n=1 Tax=Clostridium sporogenes TaxID=1509 RepID=A0A7U4JQ45_CLOSG|nr:pyridoxal phosphate-dependent aminotransferase [Clostridium sporogenes]AJD31332.1 beta-eliminating lyase family protein [Clostridium botulinum Prevot_594]AKC63218.1 aspartate aminotransferase AspB [Clostridium sporogenes]AKJ90399.1 aspartate aminotransferase [Clostridium sporogenes]KCZ67905.1 aspartate aminotransferase AspB [Clostridium sporogenes]KRU36993.1 class 1 and 2 aminotransferase [Clostridium sporogenes]
MKLSNKSVNIEPSLTLEITAKAKKMKAEGIDVIGFGAGEPDFNTPENIQKAAMEAIKKGYTKYTAASGILELKQAIVDKFKKDNGLNYETSEIIVSNGAKQCLSNLFQAILNEEDEVLIAKPYWVSYPELIKLYGGVPVLVDTKEENHFKYEIKELENKVTGKTKAIIINSPNNPTGTVYSKEDLESLSIFAKKHDLLIIADEIYEMLMYGEEKHISIGSLSEDAFRRTVVINGMSKSYSMTGWRIGYAAGPLDIIKVMSNVQSHTTSNPNSIAQYASLEALRGDKTQVENMIVEFKKRRDYMVNKVNSIENLSSINPKGAFYVMVNISKAIGKTIKGNTIKDSISFSKILLEEEKVAVVPGIAFGDNNFIRLSYATSMENIEKGLDRIEKFMKKLS